MHVDDGFGRVSAPDLFCDAYRTQLKRGEARRLQPFDNSLLVQQDAL
jgi:hypothetical protein